MNLSRILGEQRSLKKQNREACLAYNRSTPRTFY